MLFKIAALAIVAVVQAVSLTLYLICFPIRLAVIIYVKYFRKEFGRILDPVSALFSDDDHTSSPFSIAVAISLIIDGKLTLEELTQEFRRNVLTAKDSKSNLLYPELRQYCSDFMGYRFWKKDTNFRLANHIYKFSPDNDLELSSLSDLHERFTNKIFPMERSPWELVLIENQNRFHNENSTHVIFRIHHYLMDGNSICNLLIKSFGQKKLKMAKTADLKLGWKEKTWLWLAFPFEYFAALSKVIESLLKIWSHPYRIPESSKRNAYTYNSISEAIPVQDIKVLAKLANVRVSSVLHFGAGGAFGKLSRCIQETNQIPTICALGRPTHPENLTNELDGIILQMKTNTSSTTALDRVHFINRQLSGLSMNYKQAMYAHLTIVGTLPNAFRQVAANLAHKYTGVLMSVSNMPLDEEGFSICNYPVTQFIGTAGCNHCSYGLLIFPQSYMGKVRFTVAGNSHLLSKEDTERVAKLLCDELMFLKDEIVAMKKE